jgi:hypothetical protein
MPRQFWGLLALPILCLLGGCGPNVGAVTVNGTVLGDGAPASGLTVQFSPVTGERPSTGFTDADGRFELRYSKDVVGVLPGRHHVTFSWYPEAEGQKPTPAQRAVLAQPGDDKGEPYAVEITGPTKDLVIAVETGK